MREHLVDVARSLQVHPRDLARAVDQGHLKCWTYGGPYIDEAQAAKLNLPRWRWSTLPRWAAEHDTYYKAVRNMIADGQLNSIDDGPHRRWILEPVET